MRLQPLTPTPDVTCAHDAKNDELNSELARMPSPLNVTSEADLAPGGTQSSAARGDGPGVASRLAAFWYAFPIRWQILIAVLATFSLIGVMAGFIGVLDARSRAKIETDFNLELWQQFITTQVSNLDSERDLDTVVRSLRSELARARHISARLVTSEGVPISLETPARPANIGIHDDESTAPAWFISLVQPVAALRRVDLMHDGRPLASVYLTAKHDDEIAESWVLLRKLALWWLAGLFVTLAGLYVILGFILDPLLSFANGIRQLEDGHYDVRLPEPRIRELSPVAANFNLLAGALERARADNAQLYQQLIAVQEEERRQIAADLHDEVGPCLFGIIASTGSIKHQAQSVPAQQSKSILQAASEIAAISEKLKTMNRAILARLRPLALGRMSLEELLSDLIMGFARANPDVRFNRHMSSLKQSFGEAADLTLFRCVQEGITNALRHGKASVIEIVLKCRVPDGVVTLTIADNGTGFALDTTLGFGLSMMRERVRALDGSLHIGEAPGGGTLLTITLNEKSKTAKNP
jgi:two-component system sensor histidine kinase UhpB